MISAARRKKLPASDFAYPKQRKYPIDTLGRARNALSRAAQKGTSGSVGHVKAALRRKGGAYAALAKRSKAGK